MPKLYPIRHARPAARPIAVLNWTLQHGDSITPEEVEMWQRARTWPRWESPRTGPSGWCSATGSAVSALARMLIAIALIASATACDETLTDPSSGAIVTFQVANERFRILLTSPEQVAAARDARAGGHARIPNGRIVAGTQVNTGWSWHLEDVIFADATIELCDGLPSHVEREGTQFSAGRYCPWSAVIVSIEER